VSEADILENSVATLDLFLWLGYNYLAVTCLFMTPRNTELP